MSNNSTTAHTHKQRGFTLVEMLIIAPIVILTIGAFVTVIVNMTGDVLATRSSNVLAYNIQDTLDRIEQDIKLSTTFLEANNVSLTGSHQGFNNDATTNFANVDNGTNGNMLILNSLATTGNPLTQGSSPVYLANQPNACGSAQINQNTPMTINIVYFVKTIGSTTSLWRRTIMPSNYLTAGCSTPWQQPSCAPGITDSFCKTQDIHLVDLTSPADFVMQYFNTADATAANTVASNSTALASVRHTALQSTQTATATLNITQTAAGRQISQTGTIRATRLDINAASIAAVVTPTVPVAPVVTGSFAAPNTANFTWPSVPGASTYTVNYSIAGGSYVNGATGSTATSFSMTANNNQSICVTVYAVNTAGTSPFGSRCITIPLWDSLVYQNGWNDYGQGYTTGAYSMTSGGMVILKGLIQNPVAITGSNAVIAYLPVGYRPSERLIFQTATNPNVASRVDIFPTGEVYATTTNNAWVGLDGINFMPSTSPYAFTPLTLLNGWVNYGAPWATAAYTIDGNSRVHVKGLIASGTTAGETPMAALPASAAPVSYEHQVDDENSAFGYVGINSAGNILAKGLSNLYQSIQAIFFVNTYPNGTNCTISWCTLPLQNGWLPYGGYSAPRYTKATDGVVSVKGLIYGGSLGTVLANLPAGYRPLQRVLLNVAANGSAGRIDILPTGDILGVVDSSSWTSMDSINFMAEQ